MHIKIKAILKDRKDEKESSYLLEDIKQKNPNINPLKQRFLTLVEHYTPLERLIKTKTK